MTVDDNVDDNTVEAENRVNIASGDLIENARNYSSHVLKDAHVDLEQIKYTKLIKKLQSQNKKQIIVIITIIVILTGVSSLYLNNLMTIQNPYNSFSTNYLIQNLRGDTVDTWTSWKKDDNVSLHIHIQNSQYATKERLDAILDVIMSQQKIVLDDSILHKGPEGTSSVYYVGWYGALNSIKNDTKFNIVKDIHFHVDDEFSTGDIMINLTNLSNPDGYSAYTNSIVDEANHQILKSTITVYDIDKNSLEDLKTIVRHELGHGFGLAHSTAPEDLMAPIITTNYPYISECDIDAIHHLYDGGESSKVVCEK